MIFVLARCGREIDEGGRPRGSEAKGASAALVLQTSAREAHAVHSSRRFVLDWSGTRAKYHGSAQARARTEKLKIELK